MDPWHRKPTRATPPMATKTGAPNSAPPITTRPSGHSVPADSRGTRPRANVAGMISRPSTRPGHRLDAFQANSSAMTASATGITSALTHSGTPTAGSTRSFRFAMMKMKLA